MSGTPRLLGAVLAGGEGRRFGGDKPDALLAGVSLVRRAVVALAPVTDDVVIVSSRPIADASVPVLPDSTPGTGPLGGLEAALQHAAERGLDGVLVLACDLPLVDTPLLASVAGRLGDAAAVAPARAVGGVEPLCAVYRTSVVERLGARLSSGDRSLHAFFRDVGGVAIPLEALDAGPEDFLNVNTPEDRERAEALLRSRAGDRT